MKSPAHITQDAFESGQMRFPWSVHMEAYMLNNIGNVWPSEVKY
jgi:hypothetical protein